VKTLINFPTRIHQLHDVVYASGCRYVSFSIYFCLLNFCHVCEFCFWRTYI